VKSLLPDFSGNVLACGLADLASGGALVERDAAGLPVAWRLFGYGPFTVTQNGATVAGEFTAEHGRTIMSHAARKAARVPVDSEHTLKSLADLLGVEESAVAGVLSRPAGALGFGTLALRADGLWLQAVEWLELARKVIAQGVLRYFSPVVRGLADGRLRVTSVALTNTPAIDGLTELVARGEDEDVPAAGAATVSGRHPADAEGGHPARKGALVKELLAKLGALIQVDGIALSDTGEAPADVVVKIEALSAELSALRAAKASGEAFLGGVRECLALAAEDSLAVAQGKVLALAEQAKDAVALSGRVQALEKAAGEKAKAELIASGRASGKLTAALVEGWAKDQDAATLTAFLKAAPVIVPPGRQVAAGDLAAEDSAALTDGDRRVCALLGCDVLKFEAGRKAARGG
jgi:phage I-like protein